MEMSQIVQSIVRQSVYGYVRGCAEQCQAVSVLRCQRLCRTLSGSQCIVTELLRPHVCTGTCTDKVVVICVDKYVENPCLCRGTCTDRVVVICVDKCVEKPCLCRGT